MEYPSHKAGGGGGGSTPGVTHKLLGLSMRITDLVKLCRIQSCSVK